MLPRIIILDDLFGRNVLGGRNVDRENLCASFLIRDTTLDEAARRGKKEIHEPLAEGVFLRAQRPDVAAVGDIVENDMKVALEGIRKGWGASAGRLEAPWAMLLLDLCFYTGLVTEQSNRVTPGMPEGRPSDTDPASYFGLALLDAIHREFPDLPVFVLSSMPREEISLEFSRLGALGFIDRSAPDGPELLSEALWNHGLLADSFGDVIGQSLPILLALREARRTSRHEGNVLVHGERGTGKELMARYLHRMSKPKGHFQTRAFVPVNCPVLTAPMFASELYGIEAKTATGVNGKVGLIETANGGDVFLDEIADMAVEVQASLLRAIQERQVTPIGAREPRYVDVRFIAATNADIDTSNVFRQGSPRPFEKWRNYLASCAAG